jgi:hypothetical protein
MMLHHAWVEEQMSTFQLDIHMEMPPGENLFHLGEE